MLFFRDLSSHGAAHSSLSDVEWFNLCDTRRKFFKFREPTSKDNVDAVSDKLEFRQTTAKDDADTIIDKFEFPSLTESKTDHNDTQHNRSDDYQDDFFADSNINRNESKPRLKLPKKKSGDLKIDVFFDKKSSKTEPNGQISLVPKEGTLLHQNIQKIISSSSLSVISKGSTDNSETEPVDNVGDEVNRDNEAVEAVTGPLDDLEIQAANCDK